MKNNTLEPIIKWAGGKEKELPIILENLPENFENYYEPFVGGGSVYCSIISNNYFINDKSSELINLYSMIKYNDIQFYYYLENISDIWKETINFCKEKSTLLTKYESFRNENLKKISDFFTDELDLVCELISLKNKLPILKKEVLKNEIYKNFSNKLYRMYKLEKEIHLLNYEDLYSNIETAILSGIYMYLRNLYNDEKLKKSNNALATALFLFIRNYAYSGINCAI